MCSCAEFYISLKRALSRRSFSWAPSVTNEPKRSDAPPIASASLTPAAEEVSRPARPHVTRGIRISASYTERPKRGRERTGIAIVGQRAREHRSVEQKFGGIDSCLRTGRRNTALAYSLGVRNVGPMRGVFAVDHTHPSRSLTP